VNVVHKTAVTVRNSPRPTQPIDLALTRAIRLCGQCQLQAQTSAIAATPAACVCLLFSPACQYVLAITCEPLPAIPVVELYRYRLAVHYTAYRIPQKSDVEMLQACGRA